MAASRASRTTLHTCCTLSGTTLPENPIQVWSAKTAPARIPPQRSSSTTSSARQGPVGAGHRLVVRDSPRSARIPTIGRVVEEQSRAASIAATTSPCIAALGQPLPTPRHRAAPAPPARCRAGSPPPGNARPAPGFRPGGREVGHQFGARDHLAPIQRLQQVDHAPGNPVEIRDRIARRDLHRRGLPGERAPQCRVQFGVAGVGNDLPVEAGERLHLDLVHDRSHRPGPRHPDEDPARRHASPGRSCGGNRVAAMEVEQQPAVGAEAVQPFSEEMAIERGKRGHSYPPAGMARQRQVRSPWARHPSWINAPLEGRHQPQQFGEGVGVELAADAIVTRLQRQGMLHLTTGQSLNRPEFGEQPLPGKSSRGPQSQQPAATGPERLPAAPASPRPVAARRNGRPGARHRHRPRRRPAAAPPAETPPPPLRWPRRRHLRQVPVPRNLRGHGRRQPEALGGQLGFKRTKSVVRRGIDVLHRLEQRER